MASIVIELSGKETPLPPGREFGWYLYALYVKGGPQVKLVTDSATSVVIEAVEPGEYTLHVTAYAKDESPLGGTLSGDLTVASEPPPEPVFYFEPTGFNVMVV